MTNYDKDNIDWPYLIDKGVVGYDEALAGGYEPKVITVVTVSGSLYKIDETGKYVKRVNQDDHKRADDEWVRFEDHSEIRLDAPIAFTLASLAASGPDDYGNQADPARHPHTFRLTTPVVEIG